MARIEHGRTQPPSGATGGVAGEGATRTVKVTWEDCAVSREQVWTREVPEAITQDWRPGE
eukprot:6189467-Pleurochrysis_carterae.AAC.4